MTVKKSSTRKKSRRRGVLLTAAGEEKLFAAKANLEFHEYSESRLTLEKVSELTSLSVDTVMKVFNGEVRVDKQTLKQCFKSFGLELTDGDYFSPPQAISSQSSTLEAPNHPPPIKGAKTSHDLANAPDVSFFCGRQTELIQLESWITEGHTRLLMLYGMGGIGKTSLARKIAQMVEEHFEHVIWRSLQNSPSLSYLAEHILQNNAIPFIPAEGYATPELQLLTYLQEHRCLLIFDNLESLLEGGEQTQYSGVFQPGFEAYQSFFQQIGRIDHQSCILVTSREQLPLFSELEGRTSSVRSMQLRGLASKDAFAIVQRNNQLQGQPAEWQALLESCGANPLALKITASAIEDMFQGQIQLFLNQGVITFGNVRRLLDEHFRRLTPLEKELVIWLAISRQALSLRELQSRLLMGGRPRRLLECLDSLKRRSLIEQQQNTFTLQPVILEYVTDNLIEEICEELLFAKPCRLRSHALLQTQMADYILQSQRNLILQPILNDLQLSMRSQEALGEHLLKMLQDCRSQPHPERTYLAGNLINCLVMLDIDLSHRDFSGLSIWQVRNLRFYRRFLTLL